MSQNLSNRRLMQIIADFEKQVAGVEPEVLSETGLETGQMSGFIPEIAEFEVFRNLELLLEAAHYGHSSAIRSLVSIATRSTSALADFTYLANVKPEAITLKTGDHPTREGMEAILDKFHCDLKSVPVAVLESYITPSSQGDGDEQVRSEAAVGAIVALVLQKVFGSNTTRQTIKEVRRAEEWPTLQFAIKDSPEGKRPPPAILAELGRDCPIREKNARGGGRKLSTDKPAGYCRSLLQVLEVFRETNRPLGQSEKQTHKILHDLMEELISQSTSRKSGAPPFYEVVAAKMDTPATSAGLKHETVREAMRDRWMWKVSQLPELTNKTSSIEAWVTAGIAYLEWLYGFSMTPDKFPAFVRNRLPKPGDLQSNNRKSIYDALNESLENGFMSLAKERRQI